MHRKSARGTNLKKSLQDPPIRASILSSSRLNHRYIAIAHTFPITYLPSKPTMISSMIDTFSIGKLRGVPTSHLILVSGGTSYSKRRYHPVPIIFSEPFCYMFPKVLQCNHAFASWWFSELHTSKKGLSL